jgi:hypothetical protein
VSLWHPDSAEDRMAWAPIVGCALPLAAAVILAVVLVL